MESRDVTALTWVMQSTTLDSVALRISPQTHARAGADASDGCLYKRQLRNTQSYKGNFRLNSHHIATGFVKSRERSVLPMYYMMIM
jgi:hypothetical protein